MLKRWIEITHTDEHGRQVIELVPQGDTPGDSRFVFLFNLEVHTPMPNGQIGIMKKEIRHEAEARDAGHAFEKYQRELKNCGKKFQKQADEQRKQVVVPGPGTMNRLNRLGSGKNGGGLLPG